MRNTEVVQWPKTDTLEKNDFDLTETRIIRNNYRHMNAF